MDTNEKLLSMPVFPKLTDKQLECLRFVFGFYAEHFHYPSRQEIGDALHISAPAANNHIEALVKKGYLIRLEGESRNIRINPESEPILKHLGVIKEGGQDEKE